jgi:hypothetical protein
VGETEVKCTAKDPAGNTAHASFKVKVTPKATTSTPGAELRQLLAEVNSAKLPKAFRHQLARLLSAALHGLESLGLGAHAKGYSPHATVPVRRSSAEPLAIFAPATTARGSKSKERIEAQACTDLAQFIRVIERDQHRHRPKLPSRLARSWSEGARKVEASVGCGSAHKSHSHPGAHSHGRAPAG